VRRTSTETGHKAALARQLNEQLQLLRQQNHFEVIGVHWSAHHRTFRAAYDKARSRFDLARPPLKDAGEEILELAREGLKSIETAYKTLTNEEQRLAYRKKLFDATERQYSADMLVKQGEVMLLRGDRVGAMEALETAVELAPSARNKELLARCREGKPL
jgi:hypothetical protein